jgi:hypothetical protein
MKTLFKIMEDVGIFSSAPYVISLIAYMGTISNSLYINQLGYSQAILS